MKRIREIRHDLASLQVAICLFLFVIPRVPSRAETRDAETQDHCRTTRATKKDFAAPPARGDRLSSRYCQLIVIALDSLPLAMQAASRGFRTALAHSRAHTRPLIYIRSAHTDSNSPPNPNTTSASSGSTTHFGFRTVSEESKESLVRGVFDSVASSYDVMNDAMSFGVHRLWKDSFISLLRPGSRGPVRCIDVAGGTGDIALRMLDHVRETYGDRETRVDVVDINGEMLREGQKRVKKTMYHNSARAFLCFSSFSPIVEPLQRHRSHSWKQTLRHCPLRRSLTTHMMFTPSRLGSGMSPRFQMSSARRTACSSRGARLPASSSTRSQTPRSRSTSPHPVKPSISF